MNDRDDETNSFAALDSFVDAVKRQERWGLILGIALQILVLFGMIVF